MSAEDETGAPSRRTQQMGVMRQSPLHRFHARLPVCAGLLAAKAVFGFPIGFCGDKVPAPKQGQASALAVAEAWTVLVAAPEGSSPSEVKADRLLGKLPTGREWVVYRDLISGLYHCELADQILRKKSVAKAARASLLEHVGQCREGLLRAVAEDPFFAAKDFISARLADAEVLEGEANLPAADGFSKMESGFQRWFDLGAPRRVSLRAMVRYVSACGKGAAIVSVGCSDWVSRFRELFPKGAPERAVLDAIPSAAKSSVEPNGPRSNRSYKGVDADASAADAAMDLWLEGESVRAAGLFSKFLQDFPRSAQRHRIRYWLGAYFDRAGDRPRAEALWGVNVREAPLGYYAVLAQLALGESRVPADRLAGVTDGEGMGEVVELDQEGLQHRERRAIERALAFERAGAKGLAALEVENLRFREGLRNPFLLWLAALQSRVGAYYPSFLILTELVARASPTVYSTQGLHLVFPPAFVSLIESRAAEQGLDPLLVASLMKQESGLNAQAVSSVGAAGLMQLMPATAVDTDREVEQRELVDPSVNIRVGSKYLRQVLDRYGGNWVMGLAAYNAGPGALDRWKRAAQGGWGMLEFVESIGYRETRDYVSSIMRNYYWYAYLLKGVELGGLKRFWNGNPIETGVEAATKPIGLSSNREAEVHDVAVAYDVLLAFEPK